MLQLLRVYKFLQISSSNLSFTPNYYWFFSKSVYATLFLGEFLFYLPMQSMVVSIVFLQSVLAQLQCVRTQT